MLADKRYCYPLTITDFASRYLLACEALHTTKEAYAFTVFERVFKEFGLPSAIRTDNGVLFASPNALFNLSLSPVAPSLAVLDQPVAVEHRVHGRDRRRLR